MPPADQAPAGIFRALRHRNYRLFCFGQIISLCGTWMQNVAQTWLIYRLTRSELLVGATYFCLQVPVFALGPLAGLAADRRPRRRILVVSHLLSLAQALALGVLVIQGRVVVWQVLALAVALGCINAFEITARQSFVIEMVGKEDLLNAIALNSTIFNAARVAGPGLAGVLVYRLGEGGCFLLNAASFAPVIWSLLAMRLPPFERAVEESPWRHMIDGFRYAFGAAGLRYLFVLLAVTTICGTPALVLMPFFADEILGQGSRGLGALLGAMGIGALTGTLALAGRSTTRGLVRVIELGALGLGAALILLAVSRRFYLSIAVMLWLGFCMLRQLASTNTLVQTLIADQYRGRIMALYTMTVVGLAPFASLLAGAVAQRVGPPATVAAGGVLCLLATLLLRPRLEEIAR